MGKVNHLKIEEYFQFFTQNKLDSLCLVKQNYPNTVASTHPELLYVLPPAPHIMFSYQIAFWKKSVLKEMALPHENPWMSEWYGSQRAEIIKIKLACPITRELSPIHYDLAGCLHQGKWLENAVEFLNEINYSVDFKKRDLYDDVYNKRSFRFKIKKMIIIAGLKGSYFDLLKRKIWKS